MPGSSPGMTWREREMRPGMTFGHFFVLPESFTASKVANSTL
ncbi:hypothetical protein V1290_006301 [Bradyrhizobium sp. AZCC 1578]